MENDCPPAALMVQLAAAPAAVVSTATTSFLTPMIESPAHRGCRAPSSAGLLPRCAPAVLQDHSHNLAVHAGRGRSAFQELFAMGTVEPAAYKNNPRKF